MKSTPRNKATDTYQRLKPEERRFLRETAMELGDLPETNRVLQERFYDRFGRHINRFVAHYWRRTTFGHRQARVIKGGTSYVMSPEQAAFAYLLIENGRFHSVAEVVAAGLDRLAKEEELAN